MTITGLKKKWVYFCVNKLFAGTKTKNFEKKRKLLNSIGYEIGEGTKIVGPIFCTGKLVVGNDCWIGRSFSVDGNETVTIGDRCDIGPCVSFQTGGHEISTHDRRAGVGYNKPITVGNGCWIAAKTTVLGGVKIGDGSVVAAGSCVVGNVTGDILVGGVPAREIRKLSND